MILGREGRTYTPHNFKLAPSLKTLQRFEIINEDITRARYRFDLDSLNVVQWGDKVDDEWLTFLDQLGRQPNVYKLTSYRRKAPAQRLFEVLVKAYDEYPSRNGILRLVSLYATGGVDIPITFDLASYIQLNDELTTEAAVTIKVAQGNWDEDEIPVLAERTADLARRQGKFTFALKRLIKRLSHNSDVEELLLKLYQLLPSSRWQVSEEIISTLNNFMRRRTSQLRNPKVWNDLSLPAGLESLLRE